MLKRIVSGLLGVPVLLAVVYFGGTALFAATLVVALIGLYEFYQAMEAAKLNPIKPIGYIFAIAILSQFHFINMSANPIFWLVMTIIALSIILLANRKYNMIDASITLYGLLYVPVLLGHILLTSQQPNGIVIWLIFITAWGTDTCAYFAGNFFGKRKLCPEISPKKTVEGAIGGILGTMIIAGIFGYFMIKEHMTAVILIGFFGSIFSMLGDLTASVIKRRVGIKDFGNLIPGHGGILDRFDSILFTAPVIYYFLLFMINRL